MIRRIRFTLMVAFFLLCGLSYCLAAPPAIALDDPSLSPKPFLIAANDGSSGSRHHRSRASKTTAAKIKSASRRGKKSKDGGDTDASAKPSQVGSFGDWGAFVAEAGDDKTCYVLAQPKTRAPEKLKRDPAYVFISNRPGEHIHNEISITMGFPMKDGGEAEADVAGTTFDLVSKGHNAWIKNPAEEGHFVAALKHNAKLVIKAASVRGKVTTDTYSLAGLHQALDQVARACH
jgi:hypothetical protein